MISVIVPVRNAMPYLPAALASIAAQGIAQTEVIIVDGASSDGSREVAAAYPHVRLIDQQGDGLAAARNAGLAAAHCTLIAFLDADDIWTASSLATRLAYVAQHPACPGVIGQIRRFLQADTPLPPGYAGDWLEQPAPGYTPGALLMQRTLFAEIGAFDATLAVGCDSDWFARAQDAGLAPTLLAETVLYKRIHAANLSAQISSYRRELLTVARRSLQRRGYIPEHSTASL